MSNPRYNAEVRRLSKLPRKQLIAQAAWNKICLDGWMDSTNRAWNIIEKYNLRPSPHTETLSEAVERILISSVKTK